MNARLLAALVLLILAPRASAGIFIPLDGFHDFAFGQKGIRSLPTTEPLAPVPHSEPGVAVSAGGDYIVAFSAGNGDGRMGVVRVNNIGTMESSFGNNGTTVFDIDGVPNGLELIDTVAVLTDQRIVVAGNSCDSSFFNCRGFAVRLDRNGAPDLSYANPIVELPIPGAVYGSRTASAVDAEGRIYFALPMIVGTTPSLAVIRYDVNGLLDTSWAAPNGYVLTTFAAPRPGGSQLRPIFAGAAVALADGGVAVCGSAQTDADFTERFMAARFTAAGALLPSFGMRAYDAHPTDAARAGACYGIAARRGGGFVLVGTARPGWPILGLTDTGSIDLGFSGDGYASNVFGGIGTPAERAHAVKIDTVGRILIAGTATSSDSASNRRQVLRLLPGGTLDGSFGGSGEAFPGPDNSLGHDVVLDPDRPVVVSHLNGAIVIERLNTGPFFSSGFEGY